MLSGVRPTHPAVERDRRRHDRRRHNRVRRALAAALLLVGGPGVAVSARAAQTTVAISMTAPGAAPRALGPAVIAARPAAPFLYTLAATGARPLTFAATGLPAGLTLNAATGTIAGTAPATGSYAITVRVGNAAGTIQRAMTLVAGNTLALTPPMGWNSYDSYGGGVTEAEVMAAAQAQVARLQPFGWNYVVVDYLWFDPEQVVDANGRFLPSVSRFPSATGTLGFKPLADRIHAMGLNFGIHIMRGIPRKSVTANLPIAGSTATASAAGNPSDPCPWDTHMWGVNGATAAGQAWYDSIFAQYAAWGIDFVKVDDMIDNQVAPLVYHRAEAQAIRTAIDRSGRSIVLSLSPGPMQTADAVDLNANANMWRMVNDFWDVNGLSSLPDVFTAAGNWQAVSGLAQGHWPDADMLPLGYLGPRVPSWIHPSGPTALSRNEQVTLMSLWAILPSPLMFGGNVPMLATDPATGPWTTALLTNDEVLAVDQDAGGKKAQRIAQTATTEVWSKDLSGEGGGSGDGGGRKVVVALFNRGDADAAISVTWAELGLSLTGRWTARDLWQRMDLGAVSELSVTVPWRAAALILLSPVASAPDAGTMGPEAGIIDANLDVGAGGSAGSGGRIGAGGESVGPATGGQGGPGSTGGSSGPATGSAGTSGGGGGRAGAGAISSGSSGCGCALDGPPADTHGAALLTMVALVGWVDSRRRRRR